MNDFQKEWAIIHADIEKYEKFSLIIKLSSIMVSMISIAYLVAVWITVGLVFILWLQDGIWKTFQKRLESRIIFLESRIKQDTDTNNEAFQFYSQWESKRQGVVGLIKEYILNSVKPTVAYPYVILLIMVLVIYALPG